jgi:NAD dependent epimerase/dehydratase family enzyme
VVKVISRQPFKPANLPAKIIFGQWDGKTAEGWGSLVDGADAVVNLAGASLADKPWTDERKREIEESRSNAGKAMVEAISAAGVKPKVLIQSSAVG